MYGGDSPQVIGAPRRLKCVQGYIPLTLNEGRASPAGHVADRFDKSAMRRIAGTREEKHLIKASPYPTDLLGRGNNSGDLAVHSVR